MVTLLSPPAIFITPLSALLFAHNVEKNRMKYNDGILQVTGYPGERNATIEREEQDLYFLERRLYTQVRCLMVSTREDQMIGKVVIACFSALAGTTIWHYWGAL
jgi:hypothetical protein